MSEVKLPILCDAKAHNYEVAYVPHFRFPSEENLAALAIKDTVKVKASGESFWADIVEIKEDGSIIVKVNNDLVRTHLHNLTLGDHFLITKDKIFDIFDKNSKPKIKEGYLATQQ